jgi:type IV secretory pathway VirB2 component (pilin)
MVTDITIRMEVIRYIIPHLLAGCLAGIVASVGLVATNLGSLRDLMLHTDGGWLAFALLTFGMVVTFGSAAIGSAIMSIGSRED